MYTGSIKEHRRSWCKLDVGSRDQWYGNSKTRRTATEASGPIPSEPLLHGNWLVARGFVTKVPDSNFKVTVEVDKNVAPPRRSKGWRLEQSLAGIWFR